MRCKNLTRIFEKKDLYACTCMFLYIYVYHLHLFPHFTKATTGERNPRTFVSIQNILLAMSNNSEESDLDA